MFCDRDLSFVVHHREIGRHFLAFLIDSDNDGPAVEYDRPGRETRRKRDIDAVGYVAVDDTGFQHERTGGPIVQVKGLPVDFNHPVIDLLARLLTIDLQAPF